jgi:1,4-alpha-glucan branching enzyme
MKEKGSWKEIFNSDNKEYWGTGHFSNAKTISAKEDNEKYNHLIIDLPPLAGIVLKRVK